MANAVDFQRFITVIMSVDGLPTVIEFDAHASQAEIAQALCDNDLPDCPVISIIECVPSEGSSRDVTEDVARLIPAISEEFYREGERIRSCARDLMERFGLDDPANGHFNLDAWAAKAQLGVDRAKEDRLEGAL